MVWRRKSGPHTRQTQVLTTTRRCWVPPKHREMRAMRDWIRGSKPKRQEEIDRRRRRKPSENETSHREADRADQDKDREEERHKPQAHRE